MFFLGPTKSVSIALNAALLCSTAKFAQVLTSTSPQKVMSVPQCPPIDDVTCSPHPCTQATPSSLHRHVKELLASRFQANCQHKAASCLCVQSDLTRACP